jgi:hypothetical protein
MSNVAHSSKFAQIQNRIRARSVVVTGFGTNASQATLASVTKL